MPVFIKSVSTGEIQLTGHNIANIIKEVITHIGVNKVTAVVTDNAANMRAAWDILEAEYSHIFCNGCAAHTFNLLVKDICDTEACSAILEKCRFITHFVKSRTAVMERFRAVCSCFISSKETFNIKEVLYIHVKQGGILSRDVFAEF